MTRTQCPSCGKHNLCLVGDGYAETYLCMVCHFNAGRYLQNTPERSGTAREAPSTNRNGTTVGPQAAAHPFPDLSKSDSDIYLELQRQRAEIEELRRRVQLIEEPLS